MGFLERDQLLINIISRIMNVWGLKAGLAAFVLERGTRAAMRSVGCGTAIIDSIRAETQEAIDEEATS